MNSPDELFRVADQQEESGDMAGAMQSWRASSNIAPRPEVFLRLAHLAWNLGYTDEAKSGFARAIEADASSTLAYLGLATIALHANESAEAEALLDKAIAQEESAIAYCLRGVALRARGQTEQAGKSFERALEIDSAYEEASFKLGVLLRETNPARAEQLFRQAIEHCPDYQEAHRELGWLLSKALHGPDAEHHLRRAVKLDAEDSWAHVYLGNHLWRNADSASALVEFKYAVAVAPHQAFPHWSLANFYEDQCEWDEARRLYVRALELEPNDPVANMNFGRMLKKKGENELAKRYLLKALSIDPQYNAARHLLSDL